MIQLALFEPGRDALMEAPATWSEGVPDISGISKYRILVRSPHDPEEDRGHRGFDGYDTSDRKRREPSSWKDDVKLPARAWAARMLRHLQAHGSRTFNALCLELTGYARTADVFGGKAPEEGLWLLVERRRVVWANLADGCVWFAALPPHLIASRNTRKENNR